MFMSTMIEVSVDVGSSFVERRQGIKTEEWYKTLSASKLFSLSFFIGAAIFVNLWLMLCYSNKCQKLVQDEAAQDDFFQYGKLGDFEWQPAPTPAPTRSIMPTAFNVTTEVVANVSVFLSNLTCPTLPKTAFSVSGGVGGG